MRIPLILGPTSSNDTLSLFDENSLWKFLSQSLSLSSSEKCMIRVSSNTENVDNIVTVNIEITHSSQENNPSVKHSFPLRDLLVQIPFSKHNNMSSRLQLTPQEQNWLQIADTYSHKPISHSSKTTSSSDPNTNMAQAMAMKTLFRIAQLTDATCFIPITRAHIDACTYIGKGGLEFAQTLVRLNGSVAVPSTTNASSVDRQQWQSLGTPASQDVGQAACQLQDAYIQLNCLPTFSCTPYLKSTNLTYPPPPKFGEQMAWGESNAVVFANSILGARTEKYADYVDICAALVGRVPNVGVHRDDQRLPNMLIDLGPIIRRLALLSELKIENGIDALYPLLGWLCGNIARDRIPLILGLELLLQKRNDDDMTFHVPWSDFSKGNETEDMWKMSRGRLLSLDDMKAFSASFGTTATVPVFHIAYVTPEARNTKQMKNMMDHLAEIHGENLIDPVNTVTVSLEQLQQAFESLNHDVEPSNGITLTSDRVDVVALGNPNFSSTELETFFENLYTHQTAVLEHPAVPVAITLSRDVYEHGKKIGIIQKLEAIGIKFISDTCWCMLLDGAVIPAKQNGVILTNSGKYAHYGGALTNRQLRFGSLKACLYAIRTGFYPKSFRPAWLPTAVRFFTHARKIV